jgi:hypothetical protein
MSWTLSYYTRQGFHVVSAENMLFMTFNIQIRSKMNLRIMTIISSFVGVQQSPGALHRAIPTQKRELGRGLMPWSYHDRAALLPNRRAQ